jgi:hypothetical protein
MAEKTQADLDKLAAQIAPGPVDQNQNIQAHVLQAQAQVAGSPAGQKATVAKIEKADPFAEVEAEFLRQQLAKQAAHEERMRQLEVEEKLLNIERAKADLEDYKDRKDDRKVKQENKLSNYKTRGSALAANDNKTKQDQRRCNHRKGGQGLQGVVGGRGDSTYYAVIKHTFCHNDTWVCCLRCGKTWKPPLERSFRTKDEYYVAIAEYKMALDFPTLNAPSTSSQFQFSDNGASMREVLEPSKLR